MSISNSWMSWSTLSVGLIDTTILSHPKMNQFFHLLKNLSSLPEFPTRPQGGNPQVLSFICPHFGHRVSILPANYLSIPCPPSHLRCLDSDPYFLLPGRFLTTWLRVALHLVCHYWYSSSQVPKVSKTETIHFLKTADSCSCLKKVFDTMRSMEPWKTGHRERQISLRQALGNT